MQSRLQGVAWSANGKRATAVYLQTWGEAKQSVGVVRWSVGCSGRPGGLLKNKTERLFCVCESRESVWKALQVEVDPVVAIVGELGCFCLRGEMP